MMNQSADNSSHPAMKMPLVYVWPSLSAVAEVSDDNNTNATNSTTEVIPGGFGGYVHTYDLAVIGAAFSVIIMAICGTWVWCHRRYRDKKNKEVQEASNFQVNVLRPSPKK